MNAFMHFVIVIKQFCVCGYGTEYSPIHFFIYDITHLSFVTDRIYHKVADLDKLFMSLYFLSLSLHHAISHISCSHFSLGITRFIGFISVCVWSFVHFVAMTVWNYCCVISYVKKHCHVDDILSKCLPVEQVTIISPKWQYFAFRECLHPFLSVWVATSSVKKHKL